MMAVKLICLVIALCAILDYCQSDIAARPFLTNLSRDCLRCLCHAASGCNLASPYECSSDGRCGPFRLSYGQWKDAGRPTPETPRPGLRTTGGEPDFTDCAGDYRCAEHVVITYMEIHGQDCNGDQVTDCDDYMLINAHGNMPCYRRLNRTSDGREYLQRYRVCRPS
ncbi:lysozyme-like [Ctenocephalides felis]|uniref:lysozyme-like n=1 Tax=Ctenocephalides felis TaxID=7515 RepID=UPI000E6E1E3B|nr:lysozyme-like [Ctenocephalides felis]